MQYASLGRHGRRFLQKVLHWLPADSLLSELLCLFKHKMADGDLPVRHFAFSASYFTVRVKDIVLVTLVALVGAPPPVVGPVETAVTVTFELPVGVVKMAVPLPQPESPARAPSSKQAAIPCINSRRLAFLAPASPNRPKPSRRPLHQKIPVGVTIGA